MTKNKEKFDYNSIPAGFYDDILLQKNGPRSFWHYQKFDAVARSLSKVKDGKILDIGCSAGSFLNMVDEADFSHQVGVDLSSNQIQYAKKYETNYRNFIKIYSPKCLLEKFDHSYFDAVTMIEVIEHLSEEEINVIFKTIAKILKKDGELIITTPNYFSIWPILEIIISKFFKTPYEEQHITKFNFINFITKLRKIYPEFDRDFSLEFKTSSHFASFAFATISNKLAKSLSKAISSKKWKMPVGALLIIKLRRK